MRPREDLRSTRSQWKASNRDPDYFVAISRIAGTIEKAGVVPLLATMIAMALG